MKAFSPFLSSLLAILFAGAALADDYTDPAPPTLSPITTLSNGQKRVTFPPYPSADRFDLLQTDSLGSPWSTNLSGLFSGLSWTGPGSSSSNRFFNLRVTPLSSNALLSATVLSKLAYGPTPDLLDRLAGEGPGTYINEQLNPETITEHAGQAHTNIAYIESRFGSATNPIVRSQQINSGPGTGDSRDIQAWLVLNAVFADRQLLEVLTQFWENHFVTFLNKSANFFAGADFGGAYPTRAAAEWEWREVSKWRASMRQAGWTFYDMLKTSAESPAMIIYLDTATSRGDGRNIPNENYSRELQELFCMGVDNGYDQADITNMAPCWTGWTFELVNVTNAFNPFAPRSTVLMSPTGGTALTNLVGVWAMNFRTATHATYAKHIWGGKMVPARYGPPWTTKLYGANAVPGLYELNIPARTGTNGIQDGYDVVRHIADLPFTQEFLSVKLCRLFVHDDFHIGYDFTDGQTTPEEDLVHACMSAWETSHGQMRPVLATIFNSALFRGHGGNAHKVKTPLEYTVSAIRALRLSTNGTGLHGTWTSATDGYGVASSGGNGRTGGLASPLNRMGGMLLFNREAPDGYPEAGSGWVDAGSLAERIRYISSFLKAPAQAFKDDGNGLLTNNICNPVRLLQIRLTNSADWQGAGKVSDLFLSLLYPGEGRASLDYYRTIAINYLDTADDGVAPSAFAALTPSAAAGSAYDNRVRGMVAMLLSLQRFHEQ